MAACLVEQILYQTGSLALPAEISSLDRTATAKDLGSTSLVV